MAANYIEADPVKAARIHQALRAIREGRAIIRQELAVLPAPPPVRYSRGRRRREGRT